MEENRMEKIESKAATTRVILVLLLICMSNLVINIRSVKNEWSGTVYIRADGSIDPPDAPITTYDNITYTLTDNVTSFADGIIVERDNIILEGTGHTLQGTGAIYSIGVDLASRTNVTIKNINIKNFYFGIHLFFSYNNNVFRNNIANNYDGIRLYSSFNNSISRNNITNQRIGISLFDSSSNTISGNNVTNNYLGGIHLYKSSNNTVTENKINSNWGIILYGSIHLCKSTNNTISGNNITNNDHGITFWDSSNYNSIVGNNLINNGLGVYLSDSSNNSIVGNVFANDGLLVTDSYGNIVVDNLVNGKPLVYLEGASGVAVGDAGQVILVNCSHIRVENLNLSNTYIGVHLLRTTDTIIARNNIKANKEYGIWLYESSNNSVNRNNITNNGLGIRLYLSSNCNNISRNNIIANNGNGIFLGFSSNNNIIGNNIINNDFGIYLYKSSNNSLYYNNLINNSRQIYDESFDNPYASPSINVWDNGYPSGGNYWSDYNGVDHHSGPYQNETGSDGIGDTPYVINENNADRYPLMNPYAPPPSYTLTITPTVGGTTDPSPGTYTYVNGTEVSVTALSNIGFSFDYWLLNGEVRTENPITITMDKNYTLEAFFVDDIKPEISEPWQEPPPDNVQPYQNVTVWVNVTDYGSEIKNVTLWYSLNNGTSWTVLNMTTLPIPSDQTVTYEATIPGYENCTWIIYKIVAYDNAGNNATKDNKGYHYKYHVIPEFPSSATLLGLLTLIMIPVIFIRKKRCRKTKS